MNAGELFKDLMIDRVQKMNCDYDIIEQADYVDISIVVLDTGDKNKAKFGQEIQIYDNSYNSSFVMKHEKIKEKQDVLLEYITHLNRINMNDSWFWALDEDVLRFKTSQYLLCDDDQYMQDKRKEVMAVGVAAYMVTLIGPIVLKLMNGEIGMSTAVKNTIKWAHT